MLEENNYHQTEYLFNDPLKRMTEITNKTSAEVIINKHVFTYNNLDLIDTETITTGTALDSFTAGLKTYNYNNLNQLLSSTNPSQAFTYDDDGNMTQGYMPEGYVMTMAYDAENRLMSAEYMDSGSVIYRTEYSYSGDNLLAETKKYENSVLIDDTRYVKAGFLPLQERDGNNSVSREYTWGLNMGGGIGGLLNLKQSGADYSYLYDGKGNVSALIDSSQNIVASYRYDVFGKLLRKTGTLSQPFLFSTKQYDEPMGIYDYGWRFYNPTIGRWMTRDPLGEAGGINLYNFVGNNPVNWVDPLGLEIRVYSSNAFGVSGLNHAFVYSTETGRWKGTDGSSWVTLGNGGGDLKSPFKVVTLPTGMSENEFMNRIRDAKGWNNWMWTPWVNDCHSDLGNAFDQAGVPYPGAPNGRMDIDDNIKNGFNNLMRQLNQFKYGGY